MPTKRRPLTIQLNPRADVDILTNIRQLPDGQRNSALKDVLRAGFNLPAHNSNHQEHGSLAEELELLRRAVQLNAVQIEELRQENEALRKLLQEFPGYLAEALNQFAANAGTLPEPRIEIEESERLDDNSLRQRAAKMRKAKW